MPHLERSKLGMGADCHRPRGEGWEVKGRYAALRWLGCHVITAAFIASLNYINHGPSTGPVVTIYFMHMTIEVETGQPRTDAGGEG